MAIADGTNILALREDVGGKHRHAESLHVFIRDVMEAASRKFDELNAIAISVGPGSYTGLRIGVSATKGLAFAKNIPVIAINTLQSLAAGFAQNQINGYVLGERVLYIPMIDARRMEVYCAGFDAIGNEIFPTRAEIITEESFPEAAQFERIMYFGDGAEKCMSLLEHRNGFRLVPEIYPSAKNMIALAERAVSDGRFQDTAYFEPFYLKDFLAGRPKSKLP